MHVKLVLNDYADEAIIRQWKFNVDRAEARYQEIDIVCVDFIHSLSNFLS